MDLESTEEGWSLARKRMALAAWMREQDATARRDLPAILRALIASASNTPSALVPLDQPVASLLGAYTLRSAEALRVRNPTTLSVTVAEVLGGDSAAQIGRTVVKSATINAVEETQLGAINEALFYCLLASQCASEQLRIPAVHAVNPHPADSSQLFIEHLADCGPIGSPDEMIRAANALGGFSGRAHLAQCHDTAWLRRSFIAVLPGWIGEFDQLMQLLPLADAQRTAIVDGYAVFLERFPQVRAAHAEGLPALCHGDLHAGNLVTLGGGGFAILDWARVNAGRIGDDLAVLVYPWLVSSPQAVSVDDFAAWDQRMLAAYLEGVSRHIALVDKALLSRSYRLRAIAASIKMAKHYRRWVTQPKGPGERHRRALRVGRFYGFVADSARAVIADLA